MKKLSSIFLVMILALGFLKAQNDEYKSTLTAGVGFTLSGALIKAVEGASLGTVESSGIPNVEIGYDFGVTKWFSTGLIFAYQSSNLTEDISGELNEYSLSRMYVGASLLFHYANSGRVDLFSGIRLGYKNWAYSSTINTTVEGVDFEDIPFFGDGMGVQVLLFGIRGYVTDNIGINAEILGIGAPHIASLGVSYRF